jgi:hypothetical protein
MSSFSHATKKDPELWDSVVKEAKAGEKYGIEGQWNARKASYAVNLYKQRGGEYEGAKPTVKNNNLKKWLKEDWKTSTGKPGIHKDEDGKVTSVDRYLPAKAWESLSPQEKGATNRMKRKGFREGKQFVPNAKAASKASKEVRNFSYMNATYGDSKKPTDWTKKTKYNRRFKDKGIRLG